ncbi:MAG: hypothetical protein JST16_06675 [Bdellovibrionales bacterium]|nr:hypothetical protein [Bdellovibrionales bacterium]
MISNVLVLMLSTLAPCRAHAASCTTYCLSYSSPGVCNIYNTTCSDGSGSMGTCTFHDAAGNCTEVSSGNSSCSTYCTNYNSDGSCSNYTSSCP